MDAKARFLVTERFFVDRRSETLVVDGTTVPLHRRTYQVLLALMARPKALVTKRELFEQIWGNLEVSDAVLTTAIKELRQALGDDARDPWAVATVHARGYRLLLSVRVSDKPDAEPETPESGMPIRRFSRNGLAGIALVVAAVLAITFYSGLQFEGKLPAEATKTSVAVLPFDDLSKEGDQAWFADGLAEEILNSLAQSKDLLVAARTSSFRYGSGSQADIREIASALNVTHVMEGSVRRDTDTLRITAQLIRADDGFHVWSKTYDISVDSNDALSLQRNIAEDVRSTLHAGTADAGMVDGLPSIPLEHYEQYLRGRQLVMKRQPDAILDGMAELNALVQAEPDFAPGHAWLAYAYLFSTQFSGNPMVESVTAAELHVSRAMGLDPYSADTLTAAAMLELLRRDLETALKFADRAVAASPNDVEALRRRGVIRLGLGRYEDAHSDFIAVQVRDPLSPISLAHASYSWSILNDVERSLQAAREGVRWNPDDAVANGTLGRLLGEIGEYADAITYLEKSVAVNSDSALFTLGLATLYWQVGLDDRLDFADEPLVWSGLAASAFSTGDEERGLDLAQTYEMAFTGSIVGMHIYHWYGDMELAYSPAMRLAARDRLAESGLSASYRRGAIPAMLALQANGDPQGEIIRAKLEILFADRNPGDLHFARDIYGAASWQMVNDDPQEALAWLRDAREKGLVFRELHLDPIWDPIRDSGEFADIVAAMEKRAAGEREALAIVAN